MSREAIVTTAELAQRLGVHRETLYRNLPRLFDEGLPRPLARRGRYKWDRQSIDAWFVRHHPGIARPANDDVPRPAGAPLPDDDDKAWDEFFDRAYPRDR